MHPNRTLRAPGRRRSTKPMAEISSIVAVSKQLGGSRVGGSPDPVGPR